jgi:NADH-quinone oxidoreductase subunit A
VSQELGNDCLPTGHARHRSPPRSRIRLASAATRRRGAARGAAGTIAIPRFDKITAACDAGPGCAQQGPGLTGRRLPRAQGARGPERIAMQGLLINYLALAIFIGVALVIGLALMAAPFLVAVRNPDPEKVSAYECGFNAFDDARMKFDVRFYLVSILFIIFDLEVAFLFPWAVAFKQLGAFGFWSMMVFLAVLTIGFIYEWRKGALEWD